MGNRIIYSLLLLVIAGCSSVGFESNCEDAAKAACSIMKRHGYFTRIAIQETPWTNQGIYHAQCQALVGGEWKWVILESYPKAAFGLREYGEPVEYQY